MKSEHSRARAFLYTDAVGLSMVAFASYFDVYSHAHIFVGVDPWWNPAHLLLYAGVAVIASGVIFARPRDFAVRLSIVGIAVVLAAALFNEFWHRVLLFGNPLPEPFPVEPPHALLAVGFVILGVGALLRPLKEGFLDSPKARAAASFTSGSLWLIMAGSAFYIGGAYRSVPAYLFAVGAGSFAASLFVAYPAVVTRKFGYTTLSYLWLLSVFYLFFVSPSDGLPFGLLLVVPIDLALAREKVWGVAPRMLVLPIIALGYGLVYYPIIPFTSNLVIDFFALLASASGVAVEFAIERGIAQELLEGRTLN